MKPIVFLDFDGPLFSDHAHRNPIKKEMKYPGKVKSNMLVTYWWMDPTAVDMLNWLYKMHEYEIVVSSTWRIYFEEEFIKELLEVNGIVAPLHEDWKTDDLLYLEGICTRLSEIDKWLKEHQYPMHIIIDDASSGESLITRAEIQDNVLLVNEHIGIDSDVKTKMFFKEAVKRWNSHMKS